MSTKVLIIGAGNMGSAVVKGLQDGATTRDQFDLSIYDIHAEKLKIQGVKAYSQLKDLAFDVILLCVKPQDLLPVAKIIKSKLGKNSCVISILAGVTTKDIADALDFDGSIIRAMPNIAAVVGEAATALSANEKVTDQHRELALSIFNAIGFAEFVKETLMDAVTGLSGSGPAYIYMVVEALTDGGVKMGIPRALAQKLATQTVVGSAAMVKKTGQHPAVLREQVTTPGGTTIHALHELEERGLRAMLISAVEIATKQSAKLRQK